MDETIYKQIQRQMKELCHTNSLEDNYDRACELLVNLVVELKQNCSTEEQDAINLILEDYETARLRYQNR